MMKHTTEFDDLVVYGARGHTEVILTQFEEVFRGKVRLRALVDDYDHGYIHPALSVPVISGPERAAIYGDVPVLLTPGAVAARKAIFYRLSDEGATLATVVFKGRALVDQGVVVGAGTMCSMVTRIGARTVIGKGAQLLGSLASHDVTIGDFCSLGVNASVLGHVVVGNEVNIAPGAIVMNGTRDKPLHIGDGAVIGVGAVVMRDVPAGAHMVGNPAMTVKEWARLRRLLRAKG
jgi:UDP-3-O-[3-hydroxymyristoyl] glucosamine N-acyltransferase